MDNYPIGAANDPLAPYNEPLDENVEVLVRETLQRECVLQVPKHKYALRHYGDDLLLYYENQEITLKELLSKCVFIFEKLKDAGINIIDGCSTERTIDELKSWSLDDTEVTES